LCILKTTLELTLTAFANLAGIMKKAFTPEFDVKPCMDSVFFHALMDEPKKRSWRCGRGEFIRPDNRLRANTHRAQEPLRGKFAPTRAVQYIEAK